MACWATRPLLHPGISYNAMPSALCCVACWVVPAISLAFHRICDEMAQEGTPLFPLATVARLSCDLGQPTANDAFQIITNLCQDPSAKPSMARWYKPFLEPSHVLLQGTTTCWERLPSGHVVLALASFLQALVLMRNHADLLREL
jgi:hypothetical protein